MDCPLFIWSGDGWNVFIIIGDYYFFGVSSEDFRCQVSTVVNFYGTFIRWRRVGVVHCKQGVCLQMFVFATFNPPLVFSMASDKTKREKRFDEKTRMTRFANQVMKYNILNQKLMALNMLLPGVRS